MNSESPNFETCFAFNSALKWSCAILDEKLCDTRGSCPFFKTQEQFDADAAAAAKIYAKHRIDIIKAKGARHKVRKKVHDR